MLLFLTTPGEDYLQDSLLLGLREVLGAGVVDYPRKEVLYQDCPRPKETLYGRGFTLWKTLPNIEVDRVQVEERWQRGEFTGVVFARIAHQLPWLRQWERRGWLRGRRVALLDGEDNPSFTKSQMWRGEWAVGLRFPLYKRERDDFNRGFARPIAFAIPDAKIRPTPLPKTQLFAKHVQCDEAYKLPAVAAHCQKRYVFTEESAYYEDIGRSQYAITMKKAGWDCMRHYEIAANGTVMAFYQLAEKPVGCAPYGLKDMENVVAFRTAAELQIKLDYIAAHGLYPILQHQTQQWVQRQSCAARAREFLQEWCAMAPGAMPAMP
ncbi:MAG: glycosyltransferase [Pseudanabaenaceae cyanobacterium]